MTAWASRGIAGTIRTCASAPPAPHPPGRAPASLSPQASPCQRRHVFPGTLLRTEPRISANSYAAKLGGYARDGVAAGLKPALGALLQILLSWPRPEGLFAFGMLP